ncbi:pentatricopeptide repeat-containing protein At2g13600-like [Morus notabilis]|uniref:pentatricopeptide repeat-containing protein At2g13600-like n=1 Tax=Morus notabilis TaxID=981085 RepID=UPI000CED7AE8|nr:pentatricopeptide repeat-containing protein At2g13600-like [Morus notabilis]
MLFKSLSYAKRIASLVDLGKSREAITLFCQLQKTDKITEFLLSATLTACGRVSAIKEGKQFHCIVVKNGYKGDVVLMTSLLDFYVQCSYIREARNVFDEIPVRDVVAQNSMISGLCWSRLTSEAIQLFERMLERDAGTWNSLISGLGCNNEGRSGLFYFERMVSEGAEVDALTIVSVLSICANLAALRVGKQVHGLVIRQGHELYLPIGSATVDMYAKCGDMEDASLCFNKMRIKNVVSWTALIEGYGKQGMGMEAIRAFEAMEMEGVVPNEVTFLGALYACSHSGLVPEGWRVFNTMMHKYFITPKIEHYTCMVDLLARSGRLEEACSFIEQMPIKPDAELFKAFISSCRLHGNLELARSVGETLMELEPQDSGAYMLLSNLYGLVGDLEGVAKVKRLMSNRGVRKETGCTWIEIKQSSSHS